MLRNTADGEAEIKTLIGSPGPVFPAGEFREHTTFTFLVLLEKVADVAGRTSQDGVTSPTQWQAISATRGFIRR